MAGEYDTAVAKTAIRHDPKSRRAHASQKRARRVDALRDVVKELKRNRGIQSAQLFRKYQDRGLFPTGNHLPRWLIKMIGREPTHELVEAFAQFPCFYCKNGGRPCDACGGRGAMEDSVVCKSCAGLGVARCDFCDGSGWAGDGVVPQGLRLEVVNSRTRRACRRVQTLLKTPIEQDASAGPTRATELHAQRLLDLNRQMGVFENAITAVKELARSDPKSKRRLAKIVATGCRAAVTTEKLFRACAKQLSACLEQKTKTEDADPADRARLEMGAEFYKWLASCRAFEGTSLAHPLLDEAVTKLLHRERKKERKARKT